MQKDSVSRTQPAWFLGTRFAVSMKSLKLEILHVQLRKAIAEESSLLWSHQGGMVQIGTGDLD